MADSTSSESPLDALAATVGERTTEAFEILGNETRLAILVALWEAKEPGPPLVEQALPFSALFDRVAVDDSGQFNYHLDKLVGQFIQDTGDGYALTARAQQILSAVFSGSLTDQPSFEGEPIESTCQHCGGPVVIDYEDGELIVRCTDCEGVWGDYDRDVSGLLAKGSRPPVGLKNRTPQEFHRRGNTWDRHRLQSMMEGACPDCSGSVSATYHVCEDHDPGAGAVCETCGSQFEVRTLFACDVCKLDWWTPAQAAIFTDVAVTSFYYDHGLEYDALLDANETGVIDETIESVTVTGEEPATVEVVSQIDGDRLTVTLDEDAFVVDVAEEPA